LQYIYFYFTSTAHVADLHQLDDSQHLSTKFLSTSALDIIKQCHFTAFDTAREQVRA